MANATEKPWQHISPFLYRGFWFYFKLFYSNKSSQAEQVNEILKKPHHGYAYQSLLADNRKFQKSFGISPNRMNKKAKVVDYT